LPENYQNLDTQVLREMFLHGTLNPDLMGLDEYERLFAYESDNFDEYTMNGDILTFCANGLNKFEKYSQYDYIKPDFDKILERFKRDNRMTRRRKSKRVAIFAAAAVIGTMLIATVTAAAMGYNFLDLIRGALNSDERTDSDDFGNQVNLADSRFYGSMQEMLTAESLDILIPTILPDGYAFTDFNVDDLGSETRVRLSASEPYIFFVIRIGVNIQVEHYDYEVNGIQYYVVDLDNGTYQAGWSHNGNYYAIAVANKAILSEIIENLREV
jgi:hypothetical protein